MTRRYVFQVTDVGVRGTPRPLTLQCAVPMNELPVAPTTVADPSGAPRYGTYRGGFDTVDLERLSGRYQPSKAARLVTHKRWLYAFVATPECLALCSVADLSYASNAFVLVADLRQQRVLADRGVLGLPPPFVRVGSQPGSGLAARFRLPGFEVRASRPRGDERYHVDARLGPPFAFQSTRVSASLLAAGAAPPLTAVAPVDGGIVNVTQKWAGLLSFGSIDIAGQHFSLDGGVGGLDYTRGYLARRTAWRWAFACGRLSDGTPLGINLVEGFNDSAEGVSENAVWLGGAMHPLGRARFAFNRSDPLDRWSIETDDQAVQLQFRPFGAHREQRDLKVVKSRFVQPVGLFEGTVTVDGVTHRIQDVPGVTEDQDVEW